MSNIRSKKNWKQLQTVINICLIIAVSKHKKREGLLLVYMNYKQILDNTRNDDMGRTEGQNV